MTRPGIDIEVGEAKEDSRPCKGNVTLVVCGPPNIALVALGLVDVVIFEMT